MQRMRGLLMDTPTRQQGRRGGIKGIHPSLSASKADTPGARLNDRYGSQADSANYVAANPRA